MCNPRNLRLVPFRWVKRVRILAGAQFTRGGSLRSLTAGLPSLHASGVRLDAAGPLLWIEVAFGISSFTSNPFAAARAAYLLAEDGFGDPFVRVLRERRALLILFFGQGLKSP
jgi:hypothetical protein